MLWINEGFILDDAGNMLTTSYIDLRDEGERTVIRRYFRLTLPAEGIFHDMD